jgi:DNA-binding response OmpR family regulator
MTVFKEKNFKIILVDENVQFRNTLASRLRMTGFHVEFASGGFHLIYLLEKYGNYNLIIVHENMVDMPAEEMVQLIRLHKTKAELPILFISANSNEEDIFEMVSIGANEFIITPNTPQPIVERTLKYFSLIKNS